MTRSVPPWQGATDDTPIPARVRMRVFIEQGGICQICGRKLTTGDRWVCDHRIAACNGGANAESNLDVICNWCDRKVKTPADVAEKAKTYRKRKAHLGVKESRHPMPGGRKSKWKKRINGGIVLR